MFIRKFADVRGDVTSKPTTGRRSPQLFHNSSFPTITQTEKQQPQSQIMKLSIVSIAYVSAIAQSSAFTMSMFGPSKRTRSKTQIGLHSEMIGSFVDTQETIMVSPIIQQLFALMEENKEGVVDEIELGLAFKSLGFNWLQQKQITGIIKRAGSENGILRMEQFKEEISRRLFV